MYIYIYAHIYGVLRTQKAFYDFRSNLPQLGQWTKGVKVCTTSGFFSFLEANCTHLQIMERTMMSEGIRQKKRVAAVLPQRDFFSAMKVLQKRVSVSPFHLVSVLSSRSLDLSPKNLSCYQIKGLRDQKVHGILVIVYCNPHILLGSISSSSTSVRSDTQVS